MARPVLSTIDPAVLSALVAQNAGYARSVAREAHLWALGEGAQAVVTGQQMGLFLGPLFTIYKAATAILLARTLSEERRAPVVPIFWLQTEDHDLAEIATCHVAPSRGSATRLTLPASDDRISVAHHVLPEAVTATLDDLEAALSHLPHASAHVHRLRRHYRPGAGWGEAFAATLSDLFAKEGLVLLDPRQPAFAKLAIPVHRKAILEAGPIAEALKARGQERVHVRDAAPLSFFHPQGPEGPRYRLVAEGTGFAEVGGTRVHTRDALLAELEERPMSFSTSALLRPILQDTLLPTAAYVGGPAEVEYFEQLPPVYAAFGMTMPRIVRRAHFRLIERKTRRNLDELGLSAGEVDGPAEEVLARVASRGGDLAAGEALGKHVLDRFQKGLEEVRPTLLAGGAHMDRALEKTQGTVEHAVGRLVANFQKAQALRDERRVETVKALLDWLRPNGEPQERVYNLSYFAARHGERAFIERVVDAAEPFRDGVIDLDL